MAQTIKIKRGGIGQFISSAPTLAQGELVLATGSLSNVLNNVLFVASASNGPTLPYAKIDSIANGPALANEIDGNGAAFTGLLIHSASDNKFYRFNGTEFDELPVSAGSADNVANALTVDNTTIQLDSGTTFDGSAAKTISVKNDGITFAKLQNLAANTVIVRDANSAGDASAKAVTNQQILIGNGNGFTAASLSGDVSMTNAGVVTIANDAVENSMIAHGAITSQSLAAALIGDGLTLDTESISVVGLGANLSVSSDGVKINTGSIAANSMDLVNSGDINSLSSSIATDITSNSTSISTNAGNISTNATDISTLQGSSGTTTNALTDGDGIQTFSFNGSSAGVVVAVEAAQTTITSVKHDSLEIGRSTGNDFIDFGTAGEVQIKTDNTERLSATDNGVDITGTLTVSSNATISGDLTVSGTTTFLDTETLNVSSSIIRANFGGAAVKGGLEVTDATGTNDVTGSFLWNGADGADYWEAGPKNSEKRVALLAATNPTNNGFAHFDSSDNIVSVAQSSDGSILMSNGDGSFTVSNVIDGGTF